MNSLLDGCLLAQIIYSFRKLVMLGMSHWDLLTISITKIMKKNKKQKNTTHQLIDLL